MNPWRIMTEAKIRDWQRRRESGEVSLDNPGAETPSFDSLELQLLQEVLRLSREARACDDPLQATALRREAASIRVRLMIIIEQSGRPLLMKTIEERLRQG